MASVATAAARPEAPARARYECADENREYAAFLRACPAFRTTQRLNELRSTEYSRLDETDQVYLDFFGIPPTALHRPSGSEGSYEYLRALGFASGGAVRVSLGPVTTFADVYRFMRFVAALARPGWIHGD